MVSKLKRVTGYITALQEQRFRLTTDDGAHLLLTLAKNAHVSYGNLHLLHVANAHVRVEYTGESNLASGAARSVIRIGNDG